MDETTSVTAQETTPATTATDTVTDTNPTDATTSTDGTTQSVDDNPYLLTLEDDTDPQANPADPNQAHAGDISQYLSVSPYINSPEALQGAIADSHLLHDVINGQQPAGAMLEGLRQANPTAFQNVVNGLAGYIQQVTGYQFADPATIQQPESVDPVTQRMQALEAQFQQQNRQREEQVQQYRASQAQKVMLDHITTSLKGSFLEGDEGLALSLLGQKLQGKESQVIEAIEKGDFKTIDAALKQVKRDQADMYNRFAKRIAAQKNAVSQSLPKVDNPGTKAAPRNGNFDTSTPAGRIAYMNSLIK